MLSSCGEKLNPKLETVRVPGVATCCPCDRDFSHHSHPYTMKCTLVLCVVAMASNTLAEVRVEITNKAEGNAKVSTSHACKCHTQKLLLLAALS